MKTVLFFVLSFFTASSLGQELVLTGTPSKAIEIDQFGDRRTETEFSRIDLRITSDGENFYWASRGNIPLVMTTSGIWVTYIATDGSGFIRTVNGTARERFIAQSPENVVGRFTYVEHISHDLSSIIIYGH